MPLPDYRTPSPDDGHEAIRAPLADAIDRIDAEVVRLDCEVERIEDAYLLLLSVVDFARSTLATVLAGQEAIGALNTKLDAVLIRERTAAACIDALEDRIAALEPEPEPAPDSDDVPDTDAPPEDLTDTEETP